MKTLMLKTIESDTIIKRRVLNADRSRNRSTTFPRGGSLREFIRCGLGVFPDIGRQPRLSLVKAVRMTGAFLLVVFVASCAGMRSKPFQVTETVGPRGGVAATNSVQGHLMVYSGWDITNMENPDQPQHAAYLIVSESGELVGRIRNHGGVTNEDPVPVPLAPGRYRIESRASGFGLVIVPVVIRRGQVTTVWLDGAHDVARVPKDDSHLVRLPNGQVVGWRDEPDSARDP